MNTNTNMNTNTHLTTPLATPLATLVKQAGGNPDATTRYRGFTLSLDLSGTGPIVEVWGPNDSRPSYRALNVVQAKAYVRTRVKGEARHAEKEEAAELAGMSIMDGLKATMQRRTLA